MMDDGSAAPLASLGAASVTTTATRVGAVPLAPFQTASASHGDGAPHADWSVFPDKAHFVQFYEADTYLIDAVSAYIEAALRAGEAGIVIATKLQRDGVEQRLRQAGIDVDAAVASGQYVTHDAFETLMRFMDGSLPDPERFAEVVGPIVTHATCRFPRVRVFGSMVALLVADGNFEATLQLEELWNGFQQRLPFTLFCAYPMDRGGSAALTELFSAISDTHTHVIPAESYSSLPTSDDRLRAVADLQQRARWLEAEIEQRLAVEERLRVALAAERAARQEAEIAVRQRDEFLSIAAHELKTPLTSLSGQAQLALRRLRGSAEIDPVQMKRTIETIAGQANRLTMLLNQLLDVSRIEAGKLTLDPMSTDLTALVSGIIATIQPSTDRHPIRLVAPGAVNILVDEIRIEQVVTNLIDNAIKYSPDGGEIVVTLDQPTPNTVELTVRDHGIGIPPEKRAQIFERFYQAHTNDHAGGLGLGLFISRQIVELHGGQINAEHPADGGLLIRVRLPE